MSINDVRHEAIAAKAMTSFKSGLAGQHLGLKTTQIMMRGGPRFPTRCEMDKLDAKIVVRLGAGGKNHLMRGIRGQGLGKGAELTGKVAMHEEDAHRLRF